MNQELDYADMLEIPVSTVNVVKKKSFFKKKPAAPAPLDDEDIKERVVESVNERVGAYVYAEDVSDPPEPEKKSKFKKLKGDKGTIALIVESVAVGAIALGIFLTNIFMPNSAINSFIHKFTASAEKERVFSEFTLTPVVSERSDAEVSVSESGVLSFTAEGSVYPVCEGTVSAVYEESGSYTVEIAHTSTFTSVVTGLDTVYAEKGNKVLSNVPVGYSKGEQEVRVSMYDSGTLLNCYTLAGTVPVWNS